MSLNILEKFRNLTYRIRETLFLPVHVSYLTGQVQEQKILSAKILIQQIRSLGILDDLRKAEFKVFSQFGDDGIIQYLINTANIKTHSFIEFGVENYTESNTRFCLSITIGEDW